MTVSETKGKMDEREYMFDEKMVKVQKVAIKQDWKSFKQMLETEKELMLQPFDLFGNTVIHAVARSGNAQLLKELLQMLPKMEQLEDPLRKRNDEGNTLLHEVVFHKNLETVNVIMEFDERAQNKEPLLELKNNKKETPPFRAAKYGNLYMLKHLHDAYHLERKHFPPSEVDKNRRPILNTCLLTLNFGVAIWLVEKVDRNLTREKYKKKNEEENEKGLTCLQLLSRMPMAFGSKETVEMGVTKRLVYNLLPEEGYESELELDDAGSNSLKSTRDIESSQQDDEIENPPKSKFAVFSSLNYAVWSLLAKGFKYIHEIWDKKKSHKFAEHLAKLLVKTEDSWKRCCNVPNAPLVVLPEFPSNVTEKKKEIELKATLRKEEKIKQRQGKEDYYYDEIRKKWETPLFLAAASGIIEVVKIIVDEYPEAISHVNKDGLNILHVAVKHRQLEIYEYIEKSPAFDSLKPRISNIDKRTILHQAASMEYYREQLLPGIAYQLQDELDWYHRVRSIVPEQYLMHCDIDGLTAGDRLDIEHAEMHDQAKQWMKETAQSCSTVAVLIAGVVFAAAYAIPGGTQEGRPVLHHSSAFRIFTIMDVVALACSLGSVVMFLSILTSSFDLWDFHRSLPRKLKMGFLMLFFSLITTMLAFAATILLTVRMEGNKKTTTFTYSLAFVIVSVFGLTQFPLYKLLEDQVKRCSKFWKKVSGRK